MVQKTKVHYSANQIHYRHALHWTHSFSLASSGEMRGFLCLTSMLMYGRFNVGP